MTRNLTRSLILIIGFFVFLGGAFALFWIIPDRDFSEDENRVLQTVPAFSLDRLWDGTYTARWSDYVSDQIPGRSVFVGIHGVFEQLRTGGESNGVLTARVSGGTQLAVRRFNAATGDAEAANDTDLYSENHVQAQLAALNQLAETLSDADIPLCVCLPPRTIDVVEAAFPGYPADTTHALTRLIQATLSPNTHYVPLTEALAAQYRDGVSVYYRTDHHWTTRGAYEAYLRLFPALGFDGKPIPAEEFDVQTIDGFFGTTGSRSALFGVTPDTLEIWRKADDERYEMRDEDGTLLLNGFIDESYLSTKDKYGAFLGGNRRLVTVTDTAAEGDRPRLLIIKDSFANSLTPFLARHADLLLVNLSAGVTDVFRLAKAYDCDGVLVVWNLENLISSPLAGQVK